MINERLVTLFVGLTLLLAASSGCRTGRPLTPVNLREPGWHVRTGQAVWHLPQGGREIAGEVLLATRGESEAFAQFSKSPFTLVTARSTPRRWEIEFPPQAKRYAGPGRPPRRLIWLWLARAVAGRPLDPGNWSWRDENGQWRLENRTNHEWVEGYFEQ